MCGSEKCILLLFQQNNYNDAILNFQGWTAITHFLVTCDGFEQVVISVDNPSLINLDPDTTYTCEIVAVNRVGQSPPSSFVATTGSLGGLPVWLLYQATQQA